jgi:F-type H+-transporting ATPase subunit epsilon
MTLEIITPEKTLFYSENASSVTCPGIDGSFQLLDKHSAIVTALKSGTLVVVDSELGNKEFKIQSGLVECSSNKVNILVEE